jgi:hypothetical protein
MQTKKILVEISSELHAAIEAARQGKPRGPWLESELWRLGAIRTAASEIGVKKPDRLEDGRGKFR